MADQIKKTDMLFLSVARIVSTILIKNRKTSNTSIGVPSSLESLSKETLKKCMHNVDSIDNITLTIQFLWTFDHVKGRFYLNEYAYFSFETLKTKIYFYFSHNSAADATSASQGIKKPLQEAEKFILKLYNISKLLSTRPKFQLILLTILYSIDASMQGQPLTSYLRSPGLQGQLGQLGQAYYFTKEQYQVLSEYEEKRMVNLALVRDLKRFAVHFDLKDIYDGLCEIIPKAIEMDLFVLSRGFE